MKGVSLDCVEVKAEERLRDLVVPLQERKETLFELYDELFNEKSIKFDLLATGTKMKADKNRRVKTLSKFERNIKFTGIKNLV